MRRLLAPFPIIVAMMAACLGWGQGAIAESRPESPAMATSGKSAYVGKQVCAECHVKEVDTWRGSHHDLAMQPADASTVLGNFGGATFRYAGVVSRFFKRGEVFFRGETT